MPLACSRGKQYALTNWGRVTHIWVGKLTIIGSDNGLSPSRRQAIIWTNTDILSIGPLGTNFCEILIGIFIQENAFENIVWKMAAISSRPQCVYRDLKWWYVFSMFYHKHSLHIIVWRTVLVCQFGRCVGFTHKYNNMLCNYVFCCKIMLITTTI